MKYTEVAEALARAKYLKGLGQYLKRVYSKAALGLVVIVFLFAIGSFLRENWSAAEAPGSVEKFLAKWALRRAHSGEADVRNPLAATEENLQEGRQVYEKQCAFCHGLEGKGQGQTGIQFYPPVPALVGHTHEMSDGQVQWIVSNGIRYTAMPSFAKELTPEQIWKVVLWVRHMAQQPAPPHDGDHR